MTKRGAWKLWALRNCGAPLALNGSEAEMSKLYSDLLVDDNYQAGRFLDPRGGTVAGFDRCTIDGENMAKKWEQERLHNVKRS